MLLAVIMLFARKYYHANTLAPEAHARWATLELAYLYLGMFIAGLLLLLTWIVITLVKKK